MDGIMSEVVETDFQERTVVKRIQIAPDARAIKFIKEQAKFAKETDVKSALVVTVAEDGFTNWNFVGNSEHHLALIALILDDVRDELKEEIFAVDEED